MLNSHCHTYYKDWYPTGDRGIRYYLRKWSLDFLSRKCEEQSLTELERPHIQFLYIHHVFLDEEEALRKLLASLTTHYQFISHSEAVRRVSTGQIDRAYLTFSSDDGFLNNLSASRIMEEFGVSACFFLNPVTIGLQDPDVIKAFCRERLNARPVHFLDWDDVEDMQKRGHEIGSHSLEHADLGKMSRSEVAEDLGEAKATLERFCGKVDHLAFPYGGVSNFSRVALEESLKLGHKSCASALRGCYSGHCKVDLSKELILRDQIILDWSIKHIRFFLKQNLSRSPMSSELLG